MIRKFLQKIKSYDEVLYNLHKKFDDIKNDSKDLKSLDILLKMFDNNFFMPITSWSLSPAQVHHICNDIVINKRKNIIEFGAGYSTICIAQLLKINKIEATFYSIEDNQDWIDDLKGILKSLELTDYVNLIHAPLKNIEKEYLYKNQEKWYDTTILSENTRNIKNIDLLIVDGPFGGSTPFARHSAFPFFKNRLSENFAIFLDDTNRIGEKEILAAWSSQFSFYQLVKEDYTYLSNKKGFDIYI